VLRLIAEAAGFYTHFADTLLLWAGFAAAKRTAPFQALTVSTHNQQLWIWMKSTLSTSTEFAY
jgi:hypothetical protein